MIDKKQEKQVKKLKKGLDKLLKTTNIQTKVIEGILTDLESDEEKETEEKEEKEAGTRYGTSCFGFEVKKNNNIIDEY